MHSSSIRCIDYDGHYPLGTFAIEAPGLRSLSIQIGNFDSIFRRSFLVSPGSVKLLVEYMIVWFILQAANSLFGDTSMVGAYCDSKHLIQKHVRRQKRERIKLAEANYIFAIKAAFYSNF